MKKLRSLVNYMFLSSNILLEHRCLPRYIRLIEYPREYVVATNTEKKRKLKTKLNSWQHYQ